MSPLFRFSRRAALIISPLLPFAMTRPLAAQPDDTPRTIKSPPNFPVNARVVVPDPPLLTPAELQALTGGPTFITFSARDVPLTDVVKALFDAAKISSEVPAQTAKKTLSVDWKDVPFWKAAQDVEAQTDSKWDPRFSEQLTLSNARFGEGGIEMAPVFGLDGRVGADTPFVKIVANSVSRSSRRALRLGAAEGLLEAAPDATQMAIAAYFDPKLRVQTASLRALKFQPQGAPAIAGRERFNFGDFGSMRRSNLISPFTVSFPKELRSGTTVASVSGTLHTVLVSASQSWSVPDLAATPKATQTAGASQFNLESVALRAGQLTLRVSALVPPSQGQEINGFRPFGNLRVRDVQGRALRQVSSSMRRTTEGERAKYQAEFSFRLRSAKNELLEGPFSLEWPLVTEVRSLDVPFEFHDVPVP